ncbi:MAG: T9SS type A sorting domain-containing protein [Bacteroidales bacterium]|nr:T9SS type A sorting domain-containing protein [Bacteroidales bacterium]
MKNLLKTLTIIILQLSIINTTFAQDVFQFTPVQYGDVAWGDYNNDGYLDVLLTGESANGKITKIYKNNGDETFMELTELNLPGVYYSAVAWFDYDDNGELDFIIAGKSEDGSKITKLYKNNGDETFTEQSANLPGIWKGSINCFDFDNDGYPDVLLGGKIDDSSVTKLYKNNNGDGTFTEETSASFPASYIKTVTVGDYDNDTYTDVLVQGELYKNNSGDGTFSYQSGSGLVQAHLGLFFDYNNDNYLDIIISTIINKNIIIYENMQNGTYTAIDTIAKICPHGTISVLDYNNDNYLDIIIAGDTSDYNTPITKIFKNNSGNGSFTEDQSINILPIGNTTAIACGDYNNDNFTDFILTGSYAGDYFTRLYTNTGNSNFNYPEISFGNFSTFDEIQAVMRSSASWADYNKDGLQDFIISGYPDYYTKLYENNGNGTFSENTLTNFTGVSYSDIAWGDYNNDTYPDILLTGYSTIDGLISKIYKNNGNGTFTDINAGLVEIYNGSVVWGDYNNDNYLDILLTGYSDGGSISKIYKNNADETFTDINAGLTGVKGSSAVLGDYNNDNYLDILLTGYSTIDGFISKIYKNNRNETFAEQTEINITGYGLSSATWADYNNDGYLDFLISGSNEDNNWGLTELYKNNGDETFTKQADNFPNLIFAANKWFDFDNDDYLDVLLTGKEYDGLVSKIYKNNGNGTFTEQTQINLQGVYVGSADCADYNNDGFKDILLTGEVVHPVQGNIPFSSVYANNGTGNFEKVDYSFPHVRQSFVSTADFNKDGNTDMLIFGQNADNEQIAEFYKTTAFGFQKTDIAIPVLKDGTSSWGDYNRDGYLDLIICGKNNLGIPTTKLLENSTTGKFMETGIFITGVYAGYAEWADYNNDGLLDFVITGNTGSSLITKIYRNTGTDFAETSAILPGSNHALWADYNNDGLWDILLTDENNITKLFKNNGNDNFTEIFNYPDVHDFMRDIKFADYDYDGFDDIIMIKEDDNIQNKAEIMYFKNTGNGTFLEPKEFYIGFVNFNSVNYLSIKDFDFDGKPDLLINNSISNGYNFISVFSNDTSELINPALIPGTNAGSVAWADFDNDNDFDFFTCGKFNNDTIGKVFYNNGDVHNTVPNQPTELDFSCNDDTVFISWNKATDNETPQNTLTYNCYMYEIGGDTIWHSMSDKNTGKRYLQRPGNTGHNTSWFITGLDVTKEYAWSVQTIDNSFLGGLFASENTFRLAPAFVIQPIDQTVCETGSITFNTATTPAINYQWYQFTETDTILIENNEYYSNATSPNLTISNATLDMHDYELHCAATTVGGTTYSDAAILSVDELILANAGEDGGVCVLTEYQLSASNPEPAEGTWSCNVQQIAFSDIHAADAVVYNLPEGSVNLEWTVTQDNVCGINSDIVVITQNPDGTLPDKSAKPDGETELCIGSTSKITTAGANNSLSYNWEISPSEAGTISENGTSVTANWNNNYSGFADIKVQAENECGTGDWSDDFVVELKDIQATDIIQKSEIMLISVDSGYIYQWYYNESLISGANKQYYYDENLQNGNYRIKISFYEGCDKLSSIYELGDNNKSLSLAETIKIYPNPTTGKITIEIDNELLCKVKYTITDNLGRKRKESIINKKQIFIKFDEDLFDLNAGNYLVEFIFDDKEKASKQLIIK